MFRFTRYIFTVLSICCYSDLQSQIWNDSYIQYGKNDGLPSNTIYSICSDKSGFIWIGTDAGLCRFDGNRLVKYSVEDGLPNNDIFQVYCDIKNRIWIKTMGKEVCYYYHGRIHNKRNDPLLKKLKTKTKIIDFFEDKFQNVWVISYPFILNRIYGDSVEIFDFKNPELVCFDNVVTEDGIYFITGHETYFFNYLDHSFSSNTSNNSKFIAGLQIINNKCYTLNSMFKLEIDNLQALKEGRYKSNIHYWPLFLGKNSLWQLTNKGIKSYSLDLKDTDVLMKNYSVSNFTLDLYSNIWVSTLNSGLFKLNSKKIKSYKPNQAEGTNSIHSVHVSENFIIAGNNNGEVSIIRKNNSIQPLKIKIEQNSMLTFRILKLILVKNKLLICTDIGVFSYVFGSTKTLPSFQLNSCKNIYLIHDSIMVLSNTSVVYYNHNFEKLKEYSLLDRFYSHTIYNNQKLFGSENTLYYEADSLVPYQLDQPFHYRFMDMKVVDSMLVVATTEKGVFYIKDHKIIRNVNQAMGLNSNNCAKVTSYGADLFIATNNGIGIYRPSSNSIDKIMESDGLASNNVLDIVIDHDTLYAGTDNGLSVIPINSLKFRKSYLFFLNPIQINKDTIWERIDTICMRTDDQLSMTLNSISLGVKGNVRYYYRIKQRDTNYRSTLDPSLTFNRFRTGNFTFEAYSIDVNDVKSEMALLHIVIVPYWWQTNLFKWCCFLAFLSILYGIFLLMRYFIRKREQKRNELSNRIKRLELDAWKSNINPHFLFNSFNTMQSLFNSEQFEKANRFITNFSKVLRKTIDNSSKLMNTFEEEISYLENYLELEKVKKNRLLTFEIKTTEPKILDYYIPSLLLQPIIENAVKHGIRQNQDGHIEVVFSMIDEKVNARITDNGIGFPETNKNYSNSKGLKLVRDKIRIVENITHTNIQFVIENLYGKDNQCIGVIANFIFPIYDKESFYSEDIMTSG